MIPVMCRVKHNPPESYGDCLRACVASIMELDAEQVPHFFENDESGEAGNAALVAWLKPYGYAPVWSTYDGVLDKTDLLNNLALCTNGAHYLFYGATSDGGNHVVVCYGNMVVHNPAWTKMPIVGPTTEGVWQMMVIAKL